MTTGTGKFYVIRHNGKLYTSKSQFRQENNLTKHQMDKFVKGKESGSFSFNGYMAVFELLEQSERVNVKTGKPLEKDGTEKLPIEKVVGNLKLIYSGHTNKLIKTISI